VRGNISTRQGNRGQLSNMPKAGVGGGQVGGGQVGGGQAGRALGLDSENEGAQRQALNALRGF